MDSIEYLRNLWENRLNEILNTLEKEILDKVQPYRKKIINRRNLVAHSNQFRQN